MEVLIYQTPEESKTFFYDTNVFRLNFDQVMEEDFAVCRLLQANVHSCAYRVTQLAEERELGIAHFHQVLLKRRKTARLYACGCKPVN